MNLIMLKNIFKPAAHQAPLPEDKIDSVYQSQRLKVFLGIFIGYF